MSNVRQQQTDATLDRGRMSATAIISTSTEDRSGDVLESQGCLLDNYRKNPLVYFDHGLGDVTLPIAKSEDDAGRFTVKVFDDRIEATSYFSQSLPEAEQVFRLIDEKIIRTASVRFDPKTAHARTSGRGGRRPGMLISQWELFEWSWTGIPDNPDALAKLLSDGRIGRDVLLPGIAKSLASHAKTRPLTVGDCLPADVRRELAEHLGNIADASREILREFHRQNPEIEKERRWAAEIKRLQTIGRERRERMERRGH